MLGLMILFWLVGILTIGTSKAVPLSGPPDMMPSARYPLGTDSAGRQLLPVLIAGIPLTLEIGLLAGFLGLLIGTILGFTAGYFGGTTDTVIRTAADVILPIPALAILVVIASTIHTVLTVEIMALIVASLAWMYPTRTIRSQVLSIRNRAYVDIGRFSGESDLDIIFRELMPNLMPYLAASFVAAVGAGILAGDRPRSARPRSTGPANARHDHFLGDLLRRHPARHVVVVGPADRRPGARVHVPVHDRPGPGSVRQSALAALHVSKAPLLEARRVTARLRRQHVRQEARHCRPFGLHPGRGRRAAVDHRHRRREWQRQDDPRANAARPHTPDVRRSPLSRHRPSTRCRAAEASSFCATSRSSFRTRTRSTTRSTKSTTCWRCRSRIRAGVRQKARDLIEETLQAVGLRPAETLGRYPHQLSGGQRQRIMVARAVLLRPRLIIADEPVSMVDSSLRATILESLRDLNKRLGISLIYITHDLTTAYQIADNIAVLYRGSAVEAGDVEHVVKDPAAPVFATADRLGAATESRSRVAARHRGRRRRRRRPGANQWLPLRRPLPIRHGHVSRDPAAALSHRAQARGRLLPLRPRADAARRRPRRSPRPYACVGFKFRKMCKPVRCQNPS